MPFTSSIYRIQLSRGRSRSQFSFCFPSIMRMQIYLLESMKLSSQLSLKLYIPSLYIFLELLASSLLQPRRSLLNWVADSYYFLVYFLVGITLKPIIRIRFLSIVYLSSQLTFKIYIRMYETFFSFDSSFIIHCFVARFRRCPCGCGVGFSFLFKWCLKEVGYGKRARSISLCQRCTRRYGSFSCSFLVSWEEGSRVLSGLCCSGFWRE